MLRDNSNDINIGKTVDNTISSILKQNPIFETIKTETRYYDGRVETSIGKSLSFAKGVFRNLCQHYVAPKIVS